MNIWLYRVKKAFDTELKAYNKNILEKEKIKMTINLEKFAELVKDSELDFLDTQYANECESEDELQEWIQERITEQDIIYYSKAMAYLTEHDTSLNESIELAIEYGFELKNLNSETLATLLYQQNLNNALAELDLSECFE